MTVRRLLALLFVLGSVHSASAQFYAQHSGTTANLNGADFWDTSEGWVVGDAGTVLHTLDSGKIWTKVDVGANAALNAVAIDYYDFRAVNFVGAGGKFYGTRDGINWYSSTMPGAPTLNAVDFPDIAVGYAAGSNGSIFRSIDSGHTWTKVTIPSTANFYGLYMYDDLTGWVLGANGTAYYTDDAGGTWTKQDMSTTADLRAMSYGDDTTAWVVGNKVIIKSTDDAYTFATSSTTADLRSVAALSTENAFAVGVGGKILVTTDGKTWQAGPTLTTADLNDISAPDGDDLFIVGGQGTILSTVDPGTNAVNRSTTSVSFSQAYPNPASTVLTISRSETEPATMVVYDALGREILRQTASNDPSVDVRPLANGIYRYVLQTGGKTSAIGKFTVQH